jgi:hypothetical protein
MIASFFTDKNQGETMIKHIVMWTFKETAPGRGKQENLMLAKEKLEAMVGKIPGMTQLEAGINFQPREGAWDLALYSEFETKQALEGYQTHPEHLKVIEFLRTVRDQRAVVDYQV